MDDLLVGQVERRGHASRESSGDEAEVVAHGRSVRLGRGARALGETLAEARLRPQQAERRGVVLEEPPEGVASEGAGEEKLDGDWTFSAADLDEALASLGVVETGAVCPPCGPARPGRISPCV